MAGDYDLVIIVRVRDHDDLASARSPGTERTHTFAAFKVSSRHDVEVLFSLGFEEETA